MAAEVVVVIVVNMELKTPTPKAPRRRCTATGVDLPDDTGRFVFMHKWLRVLNMNGDIGMQRECLN